MLTASRCDSMESSAIDAKEIVYLGIDGYGSGVRPQSHKLCMDSAHSA